MAATRIMLMNALHGYHGTAPPYKFELARARAAARIVNRVRPDVLAVVEACYGGQNPFGVIVPYAELFGFPYLHFEPWGRYEWGNAVLSKYPLTGSRFALGQRTGLFARIAVASGALQFYLVHLDPRLTDRHKWAALSDCIPERPRNSVLLGDFNATEQDGRGSASLISEISQRGMQDCLVTARAALPTAPTEPHHCSHRPHARIDYVFASSDLKVLDAHTILGKDADLASDHYPLYVDIDAC